MVTVKIDERTKDGKALIEFLKSYSAKSKGVQIIKRASAGTHVKRARVSSNIPNAETEEIMKENDRKGTKNLKKFDNVDALFEDMGI